MSDNFNTYIEQIDFETWREFCVNKGTFYQRHVILLKFSFNLDFGKSRGNARQRMSNEDTNTGIMSGSR